MSEPYPPQDPPMPVQPINYAGWGGRRGRPGIITAIGVLSITLGGLGIVANPIMALYAVVIYSVSTMMARMTAPPPPAATLPVAVAEEEPADHIGPRGLKAEQRQMVVQGLTARRKLSEEQVRQLELLLGEWGQDMLVFPPEHLSVQRVRDNVSEHGRMPSSSAAGERDFFVLGEGRLEVGQNNAVFHFSDGRPALRTSGGGGVTYTSPLTRPPAPVAGTVGLPGKIPAGALAAALVDSALGLAAGIYLLVIGIVTLRQSMKARMLHYAYAAIKLPLLVLTAVGWGWFWGSLMGGMAGGSGAGAWVTSGVAAGVAAIYPVALLVVLGTRAVREYYAVD